MDNQRPTKINLLVLGLATLALADQKGLPVVSNQRAKDHIYEPIALIAPAPTTNWGVNWGYSQDHAENYQNSYYGRETNRWRKNNKGRQERQRSNEDPRRWGGGYYNGYYNPNYNYGTNQNHNNGIPNPYFPVINPIVYPTAPVVAPTPVVTPPPESKIADNPRPVIYVDEFQEKTTTDQKSKQNKTQQDSSEQTVNKVWDVKQSKEHAVNPAVQPNLAPVIPPPTIIQPLVYGPSVYNGFPIPATGPNYWGNPNAKVQIGTYTYTNIRPNSQQNKLPSYTPPSPKRHGEDHYLRWENNQNKWENNDKKWNHD